MNKWIVSWNFNRPYYKPGDNGEVHFRLNNKGNSLLYLANIGIQFKYQKIERKYYALKCSHQIRPLSEAHIGSIRFQIPESITGIEFYRMTYHLYKYSFKTYSYKDLGVFWSDWNYYVKIIPTPNLRAFISRGLHPADKFIADSIVEMIKEWGFETYTVGLEIIVDRKKVKKEIRERLIKSDCLIAIATPRYYDCLEGLWRTLEWLQGEVGVAYGLNRPILVVKDKNVRLGGLAGEFKKYSISFDSINLESFKNDLGKIMPPFRRWISKRKRHDFLKAIASIGIPLGVGGIFGYLIGRSKR